VLRHRPRGRHIGLTALPPRAPLSEHELIERCRAGDEDAFAQLVLAHADRVYGALRRFGLDAGEADDVTQEVFLRAWRGLARFEERAQLATWLYRIAFNEAQRRLSRRQPPRVEPPLDGEDQVYSVPEATHLGPQARALDHEFEAILERALAELPPDWRAAVVLRDIEGLSTDQAAAAAGLRQAAFKSRLHRGRMQLRALLEPYLALNEE
jgi:RNA polymerase sigma-70 factor (ECF subfamily)